MSESRRDFLGLCACGVGACAGYVGLRYLIPPESEGSGGPVDIGAEADLKAKGHLLVPYRGAAAIVIVQGGKLRAFNARCTHAGCNVVWQGSDEKFLCPCHGGVFDSSGKVLAGPPPKPLIVIPASVRGDRIFLGA